MPGEKKRIILTGGGTAGHVTPNIALLPELKKRGYEIFYVGSKEGMEKELISNLDIPYYGISSGKLRRYFDLKNFTDPFRIQKGYHEAKALVKELQPDVLFSKGGFVTVPMVIAASKKKVPCILHESDISPGLANRMCIRWSQTICTNFPETLNHLPAGKAQVTGSPIRAELFEGDKAKGLAFCGFDDSKPVIMIMGGSLGSVRVNDAVREILPELLKRYQVVHLCGRDKLDASLLDTKGYMQFEYVSKELKDLMAACEMVVSRAGANAICELAALNKPNLLIPLSLEASRGDQILNAESFERQGYSYLLKEEDLTSEALLQGIDDVMNNRERYIMAMENGGHGDAVTRIADIIDDVCNR